MLEPLRITLIRFRASQLMLLLLARRSQQGLANTESAKLTYFTIISSMTSIGRSEVTQNGTRVTPELRKFLNKRNFYYMSSTASNDSMREQTAISSHTTVIPSPSFRGAAQSRDLQLTVKAKKAIIDVLEQHRLSRVLELPAGVTSHVLDGVYARISLVAGGLGRSHHCARLLGSFAQDLCPCSNYSYCSS